MLRGFAVNQSRLGIEVSTGLKDFTVDHSGVVALLQPPRANPCTMPGLGYAKGGPDRAASITDHQHHRIQACKESNGILRLSLSASHSFRGVL